MVITAEVQVVSEIWTEDLLNERSAKFKEIKKRFEKEVRQQKQLSEFHSNERWGKCCIEAKYERIALQNF